MKSNYKRLGDYIRQVDVRNRDLAVDNMLGLSISKQFIPSIANTIGTDMANYKIVQPRQFGYVPVTSRNGDKITVALYEGDKLCIISQAYIVFEVSNTSKLLPEYLMMWFRRPEFDRYARFKSHGSAREVFEWDEMCEVMLPVPPIEEQGKIVAEYQTVQRRIENNRRLIAALEDTAKTIYRKMFVDNIDPNNLPSGWRMGYVTDLSELKVGGDKPIVFSESSTLKCNVPIFSNGVINEGLYGYTNKASISKPSFTISARGTIGKCFLRLNPYFSIVRLISVIPKNVDTLLYQFFFFSNLKIEGDGSVQNQLTAPFLESEKMIIPDMPSMGIFNSKVMPLYQDIENINKEIHVFEQPLSLLLTKLSKI